MSASPHHRMQPSKATPAALSAPTSNIQPAQRNFQTVFRLTGRKGIVRKPKVDEDDSSGSQPASYTRRSHTKSRTGCANCKGRRVKCDEGRPQCMKCSQYGIDCDYRNDDAAALHSTRSTRTTIRGATVSENAYSANRETFDSTTMRSNALVTYPRAAIMQSGKPLPKNITPYFQTMRHFQDHTCRTITTPEGQRIFGGSILALADQSDYLMHAIMGTAAAHLWYLTSPEHSFKMRCVHAQAQAYHWQQAIRGFRKRLMSPAELQGHDIDALLSTCMLVGIHLYFSTNPEPEAGFVTQPPESRADSLKWLRLQSGFRVVVGRVRNGFDASVWSALIKRADPPKDDSVFASDALKKMIDDFNALCHVEVLSPESDPYSIVLKELFMLHQLEPNMDDFPQYVALMGRAGDAFQNLLIAGDPGALLILAHWLALMYRLDLWWIKERAASECRAIIHHLDGSADLKVQRLLTFPARTIAEEISSLTEPRSKA